MVPRWALDIPPLPRDHHFPVRANPFSSWAPSGRISSLLGLLAHGWLHATPGPPQGRLWKACPCLTPSHHPGVRLPGGDPRSISLQMPAVASPEQAWTMAYWQSKED